MRKTADNRPEIALDEFVIMPDHIHAIVAIMECDGGFVGARRRRAPTCQRHNPTAYYHHPIKPTERFGKPVSGSIPTIIRAYKSAVTTRINQIRDTPGAPVWQRNYWEHIIRNNDELSKIREYIQNNPMQWETDMENRPHTPQNRVG